MTGAVDDVTVFKDKEEAWRAARKVERDHHTRATVIGVWGTGSSGEMIRAGYVVVTDEYHFGD